jgi:hypothetical protein
MIESNNPVFEAIRATGPDEALASKMQLYGRFVGSWRIDVEFSFLDGTRGHTEGEVHFDWALEGRAIQDVFIFPARKLRVGLEPEPWWRYGSTFRWYDPAIDAWHSTFFDPKRRVDLHLLGRPVGDEIVNIGHDTGGLLRRWRFLDITDTSWTWLGEVSWDNGSTWTFELQMKAERNASAGTTISRQ